RLAILGNRAHAERGKRVPPSRKNIAAGDPIRSEETRAEKRPDQPLPHFPAANKGNPLTGRHHRRSRSWPIGTKALKPPMNAHKRRYGGERRASDLEPPSQPGLLSAFICVHRRFQSYRR